MVIVLLNNAYGKYLPTNDKDTNLNMIETQDRYNCKVGLVVMNLVERNVGAADIIIRKTYYT